MKPFVLAIALLLTLSAFSPTFAQPSAPASPEAVTPSDPQAAFEKLKTLAGTWVGPVTVTPETEDENMKGMVAQLTLRGTGYGHGIGMCQWGAIGRARAGQDFRTILRTYYPGTTVGRAG